MKSMTRVKLLTILIAFAAPIWVVGQTSNFMGGTPGSVDPATCAPSDDHVRIHSSGAKRLRPGQERWRAARRRRPAKV